MYIIASWVLAIAFGVATLNGLSQGSGLAVIPALLCAFFTWSAITERKKHKDLEMEHARLKQETGRKTKAGRLVTVAFRDPSRPNPLRNFDPAHGYVYLWPFKQAPKVGDWVVAPGMDGPANTIVGYVGVHPENKVDTSDLKELISIGTLD